MTKRQRRLLVVAGLVVSLAVFTYFVGCSNSPTITRLDVTLKDLPATMNGIKIVQLSDLHFKPPYELYDKVASLVNAENADIIVITGDFIETTAEEGKCVEFLGALKAKHGKYAVLGNWEHWSGVNRAEFQNAATQAGFTFLVNGSAAVDLPGGKLWLAGVDDPFTHHDHLDKALEGVPQGKPTILLAHAPNIMDAAKAKEMSLVLAGHTHGGQVRLPLIGPLYTPEREMRKYDRGMFREGETRMYVNSGIGVSTVNYRFFCRPEITVITLRGK